MFVFITKQKNWNIKTQLVLLGAINNKIMDNFLRDEFDFFPVYILIVFKLLIKNLETFNQNQKEKGLTF